MNILVALDSNYVKPLRIMLKSLFFNNPQEKFTIYLMHSTLLKQKELVELFTFIKNEGNSLEEVYINDNYFKDAPVNLHFSKEMYYRLLAFKFLPQNLERVLYLDPDILILNSIKSLYELEMKDYLYAATCHNMSFIREINKIRLKPYEIDEYYNSGVLLMNLGLQRQVLHEDDIYEFIDNNQLKLIMPDQDVLNALYPKKIKGLDRKIYNYDARRYLYYKLTTDGKWNMDNVIRNTVVLHFCGRKKPWQESYTGTFHSLYKHYEKLTFPIHALSN
ncbi:MAG: glycosyltransferase family 8 protein [Desulfitobacteriaceae bacterium]|nr:glycosyltransferase family 8 protein [Desulfitobacteriaceae bacterium]MDD4345329.1 glycosyltransferase family 8 protein [Desulfitobacteriaceae bacterium]MDD4400348.1 glycosyltransferase family 8 protein [Desulfitobacteriaceae bacterium]